MTAWKLFDFNLKFPTLNFRHADLLVVELVLPEELLYHERDALHPRDCMAFLIEIHQVASLAAQGEEELAAARARGQDI